MGYGRGQNSVHGKDSGGDCQSFEVLCTSLSFSDAPVDGGWEHWSTCGWNG